MAKIVVLEDDAATRRLVCAVLKKAGHEVIDVDNGAEGLLIVLAEQPDVVVSDVEMPKLNGFEVLAQIRQDEYTAHTPVILLTSLSSQADIRHGIRQGADDYITKPFEPERLLQSVDKLLDTLAAGGHVAPIADFSFDATQPASLELSLASLPRASEQDRPVAMPPAAAVQSTAFSTPQAPARRLGDAWALNLQVMNAAAMQNLLPPKSWRLLVRQLFSPVSKDEAMRRADYLDLREASLTLFFVDNKAHSASGLSADSAQLESSASAAQAALDAMVRVGAQCRQWAAEHLPQLAGMPPRVVVSLHRGPIEVQRVSLEFGGERDAVIGQTADLIADLRQGEPPLAWRVLGTASAVQACSNAYRLGAQMDVSVGNQDIRVHALMGRQEALSFGDERPKPVSADWI